MHIFKKFYLVHWLQVWCKSLWFDPTNTQLLICCLCASKWVYANQCVKTDISYGFDDFCMLRTERPLKVQMMIIIIYLW